MDVNQLEKLMRNLLIKETRTDSLDLLESKCADLDQDVYQVMLQSASLSQFLADANSDQLRIAARMIYDKAPAFYPNGSLVIDQFIGRCLTHPKSDVKLFGLKGAATMVKASVGISSNTVQLLIQHCLPMEEGYVQTVQDVLIETLPALLAEPDIQANLNKVLECNETIRCRVYDIVCTILEKRPDLLPAANSTIQRALADLDKDDVLLQAIVLPILSQLLVTQEGYAFIERLDLFRKVYTKFVAVDVTPYIRFVMPNALKFLAKAASAQPALFLSRYPEALDSIFDKAVTGDPMLMSVAYDCLGIVGHFNEGKIYLCEHQKHKMDTILKELPNLIHSTTESFKIRFICALTNLLSAESEPIDNRISSITQKWYETMTEGEDLEMVLELLQNPFPNIRMATLKLLSAIVAYRWGQTFFQNTACLGESLLDRTYDVDVNLTQYKYDIIKKLSQSTTLDSFMCDTLKQYVSEGAFYCKANVEVFIEGRQ